MAQKNQILVLPVFIEQHISRQNGPPWPSNIHTELIKLVQVSKGMYQSHDSTAFPIHPIPFGPCYNRSHPTHWILDSLGNSCPRHAAWRCQCERRSPAGLRWAAVSRCFLEATGHWWLGTWYDYDEKGVMEICVCIYIYTYTYTYTYIYIYSLYIHILYIYTHYWVWYEIQWLYDGI